MKEKRSPSQLEALWKESDMSNGRKVDAMVVILRTNGCCWVRQGGCTMCGYREASLTTVGEEAFCGCGGRAAAALDHEVSGGEGNGAAGGAVFGEGGHRRRFRLLTKAEQGMGGEGEGKEQDCQGDQGKGAAQECTMLHGKRPPW